MKYTATMLLMFVFYVGLCQERPLSKIVDTASNSIFTFTTSNKLYSEVVAYPNTISIVFQPPAIYKVECDSYIYYGEKLVAIRYKSGLWKYYDKQKTIDVLFNNNVSLFAK